MARYFDPSCDIQHLKDIFNVAKKVIIQKEDHDELHSIDEDFNEYHYKHLTKQVSEDLEKVEFDAENVTTNADDSWGIWKRKNEALLGYQTLDNGMTFFGIASGGDWETPIFYIIYFDGKKLRGYIPTEGNTWNTFNHKAFGNQERDEDEKFLADHPERQYCNRFFLIKDIKERILSSSTKKRTSIKPKKTIKELIEESIYHFKGGVGDGACELWLKQCSLCCQLVDLGLEDRAKIVLKWIQEDSKKNTERIIKKYGSLNNVSSYSGIETTKSL